MSNLKLYRDDEAEKFSQPVFKPPSAENAAYCVGVRYGYINGFDAAVAYLKEHPEDLQARNFDIRLKAVIDKRYGESGLKDRAVKGSKDWDDYKEAEQKFFESMEDITLASLQGIKPAPPIK